MLRKIIRVDRIIRNESKIKLIRKPFMKSNQVGYILFGKHFILQRNLGRVIYSGNKIWFWVFLMLIEDIIIIYESKI